MLNVRKVTRFCNDELQRPRILQFLFKDGREFIFWIKVQELYQILLQVLEIFRFLAVIKFQNSNVDG